MNIPPTLMLVDNFLHQSFSLFFQTTFSTILSWPLTMIQFVQRDLAPLWDVDLGGRVNGAVETCRGDDEWVMSKRLRNYNFSHPLIAKHLDPEECAWAYGMNVFDLQAWRKTDIKETHHSWLKEVSLNTLSIFFFRRVSSYYISLSYSFEQSIYYCYQHYQMTIDSLCVRLSLWLVNICVLNA